RHRRPRRRGGGTQAARVGWRAPGAVGDASARHRCLRPASRGGGEADRARADRVVGHAVVGRGPGGRAGAHARGRAPDASGPGARPGAAPAGPRERAPRGGRWQMTGDPWVDVSRLLRYSLRTLLLPEVFMRDAASPARRLRTSWFVLALLCLGLL